MAEEPEVDVGDEMAPLLQDGVQDGAEEERPGLSNLGTTSMTVNTIIGAGILGLPYAFYHSGAWLALGSLALSTLLSGINVGYLVEVSGWCEGFKSEEDAEENGSAKKTGPERFEIKRKFEMSEMCGMLLAPDVASMPSLRYFADEHGKIQLYRRFLEFAFFSYVFGSCWLYATVFASTLSMLIEMPGQDDSLNIHLCWEKCTPPKGTTCQEGCVLSDGDCLKDSKLLSSCWASYDVFLAVYLGFQAAMCFVDLNTFKNIQVVLSGSAFVAIFVMVSTSILAIVTDSPDSRFSDHTPEFNPAGVVSIITTGLFAQMCHQGVPVIINMAKDKSNSKLIFSSALVYTLVLYAALGFCCSYHLGPKTNPIITLNWIDYTGGVAPDQPVPFWAVAARWLVLFFPICSVSAAFSLQILPLAETLTCLLPPSVLPSYTYPAKARLARLLLTALPICAAAGLRDVERILEFNGIFGFIIGFFTPCFLQLAAVRRAKAKTPYWDIFSSQLCTETVIFISGILFAVTVYQTVRDYVE